MRDGPVTTRPLSSVSIPSRFETSLLLGTKERHGFGGRTHRFLDSETEVPGPGQYGAAGNGVTVRRAATCGSVSSKGYTGLVSRTDRFWREARLADRDSLGPGPGTYAAADQCAPPSRALAGHVPAHVYKRPFSVPVDLNATLSPGPGRYKLGLIGDRRFTRESRQQQDRPSGAYLDEQPRFRSEARDAAKPAPGTYDAPAAEAFMRTQGRSATTLPDGSFRSKVEKCVFLSSGPASANTPGPGAYEPDRSFKASRKDLTAGAPVSNSSMFSNTNTSRFGVQYSSKLVAQVVTPGPGERWKGHDAPSGPGSRGLPAFRLKSERFEATMREKLERGPGPAFYQPTASNKKSFILNASQRWV